MNTPLDPMADLRELFADARKQLDDLVAARQTEELDMRAFANEVMRRTIPTETTSTEGNHGPHRR